MIRYEPRERGGRVNCFWNQDVIVCGRGGGVVVVVSVIAAVVTAVVVVGGGE